MFFSRNFKPKGAVNVLFKKKIEKIAELWGPSPYPFDRLRMGLFSPDLHVIIPLTAKLFELELLL